MNVLSNLLLVASLLLCLPLLVVVGVLVTQVIAQVTSAGSASSPLAPPQATRLPIAVLVPAHNEALGVAEALATIVQQLSARDRLLVVADNCSDDTAAVARAAGAEVVERASDLRGKGYALAFGIDHLRTAPPAAVVIVDADCSLAPGALDALAGALQATQRPVQALYLMLAAADPGLGRRLAEFAWRVRNWVRPAGWHRLGMPCQLMGTGMAFTWEMLRDAPLANASIVEDMKLGIDLALRGAPPVFCEHALVTSRFPDSVAASGTQRTRWEHGHLELIQREVPPLLRAALARRNKPLLGMALDLAVPPLALLAGLTVLAWLLAVAGWLMGGGVAMPVLASALLGLFILAILLAWSRSGRDLVRLAELLAVPWYIVAKVPLYVRFIFRRQKAWVRTDRK